MTNQGPTNRQILRHVRGFLRTFGASTVETLYVNAPRSWGLTGATQSQIRVLCQDARGLTVQGEVVSL